MGEVLINSVAWNLVDLMASRAPLQRGEVLGLVRRAVDFDHAALVQPPPRSPQVFFKPSNMIDRFRRRDVQYRLDAQPVREHALAHRGVSIDTRVLSASARGKRAFYSEIVRPQNIRSLAFVLLPRGGDSHATLTLARTGSRAYSDHEVRALQQLLPFVSLSDRMLEGPPSFAMLSPREHEVTEFARLGYRNADIALACGCSVNTVHNHLKSIFRKLDISSRVELTAMAQRFGH